MEYESTQGAAVEGGMGVHDFGPRARPCSSAPATFQARATLAWASGPAAARSTKSHGVPANPGY